MKKRASAALETGIRANGLHLRVEVFRTECASALTEAASDAPLEA